ncbi:MAG TPA: VCBS repeat-containing protein [Longimicrobiales bacterium]|nr:VCBS repeat-containing protein [Longimicrobiales bacterium]
MPVVLVLLAVVPAGCGGPAAERALFELLAAEATGVTFVNALPEDPGFNILTYLNYYNGGGVAVGDVDGDGLPDLYFTANLGANRLYLNRGDYRFEDVTERAGVAGAEGWTSGATMADVNGDGHVDIYVSGVSHLTVPGRNILYVNDGDGTFTDRTAEYGLEHTGYSTQALFFDYDGDGDLDMYLLNHSVHSERGRSASPQRARHPRAGDRLFRNDGGRFTDVSEAAGIHGGVEGYGLGVVASDLDMDGCPDLFVANDFQENDFLYLNNCDGTFRESIASAMAHTSRSSMGVDAADFNNDLRPDVLVLDMLPEREEILRSSANAESYEVDHMKQRAGYHPQVTRNTLHLNRGAGRFSEIGLLAGVHATDWSWAGLFADLDNDGLKDLFVTNGIWRRPNDMDYLVHVGDPEVQAALERGLDRERLRAILDRMPHVPVPNYAYRNNGDLTFTNMADAWGLAQPGFSTGAAYVDLNRSGALDLVVNNINAPAAIYRNRARERNGHHFLAVVLRGVGGNTAGIGAKVVVGHGGVVQLLEQMPTRGFQSSVDHRLHFGLGRSARIDSLVVTWPDRRVQVLRDLPADTTLTLAQADAAPVTPAEHGPSTAPPPQPLFAPVPAPAGFDFRHEENVFFDFRQQPLMPHRLSTEGPALAVADVDGDGLDDLFIGGAKWQPGALFIQRADGTFRRSSEDVFEADRLHEDVDAAFFDANGDGHPDLYVVSGGNEFWGEHEALRDRLYLNDGRGGFRRATGALPDLFENGGVVAPGDFDGDGDVDLFVGGRVVGRAYGEMPRSVLLINDGAGRFTDATAALAPGLADVGMVAAATWADTDGDGRLDLVVAGEWMPVRVFRQEGGRLVDRTVEAGLGETHGWWNSVAAADLDGDGDVDLVLGNLGLNAVVRASREEPTRLHVADLSGDGAPDPILTSYRGGVSHPLAGRDELVRAIPSLRVRVPTYADFAASRIEDILPRGALREARVLEAYTFASAVALNRGDGKFTIAPLPVEAQLSPIHASLVEDLDGDGLVDLLIAGNFHGAIPALGRHDAGWGLLLRGTSAGFEAVDPTQSGVAIPGEVRALATLRTARGQLVVAARNNDTPVFLRWFREEPRARAN